MENASVPITRPILLEKSVRYAGLSMHITWLIGSSTRRHLKHACHLHSLVDVDIGQNRVGVEGVADDLGQLRRLCGADGRAQQGHLTGGDRWDIRW